MEKTSILDKIIDNQKEEEVNSLDAVEIINNLFSELTDRERDVLIRRHGLHSSKKETLESIGSAHNLTRERIRQIETSSVKKLQQLDNLTQYVDTLRKVILELLEEHGGLMEKGYLLDLLVGYSLDGFKNQAKDEMVHKNYLNFLITKLLHKEFEEVNSHKYFNSFYKLKYQDVDHFEEIVEELVSEIKKNINVLKTVEIIELAKKLNATQKHSEKVFISNGLDIAKVLKNELFNEPAELINGHKVIYSLLKASKHVKQNKFGHWGHVELREIKPKTINDKIYLVLKNSGQPMHFAEIADKINEVSFDHKKANAATVHNELILDEKFVLVGRGLYGMKEWGYKSGTVADVIEEILKENTQPLSREEIIIKVLEKRMVKKATIILALMNKEKFGRAEGKYILNA